MKKHLFFLTSLLLIASCEPKEKDQNELSLLIAERDSISELVNKSQIRLNELSVQISELDTTQKTTFVSALNIDYSPFKHFIEVYGTVESDQNTTLLPETGGTINQIYVREGEQVKKGQILIQLDATIIKNNLSEVETQLELAKTLFEKQERLWKQSVGSEVDYLRSKNGKEALEKQYKTLQSQLAQTSIRAPFSGVIDEIFAKLGQLAGPQTPLIRLINLDVIHITGDIPESYIGKITQGSEALVEFGSLGKTFETKISQTGNFINPANRTYKIRLEIDNKTHMIKPNAMANIKIIDYQVDSAIALPNRVIQQDPFGNNFIFTIEETSNGLFTVKKVPVVIGRTYQGITEVLEGLKTGVQIVDKGSRSIKDLQKVKLINDTETEA